MECKKIFKNVLLVCALVVGIFAAIPEKTVYAAGITGSTEPLDAQEINVNTTYTIDYLGNRNADININDIGRDTYFRFTVTKPNDYYLKLLTLAGDSNVYAAILNEDLAERKQISSSKGDSQSVGSLYLDEGTYYLRLEIYSQEVSAKVSVDSISKPAKVTDLKVAMGGWFNSRIDVSWTGIGGVTGYQVQYAQKSSMKGAKSIKETTTSTRIENIKPGKTYYVRVRAYNESSSGKKYYGAWTKVKKIKVPKN